MYVSRWHVNDTGMQYDRILALFDVEGQALTAREHPRLLSIRTRIKGDDLEVYEGEDLIAQIPLTTSEHHQIPVRIHRYAASGSRTNQSLNEWFSDYLSFKCSLLYYDPSCNRRVLAKHGGQKSDRVAFSDQAPLLIISEASLHHLNDRLEEEITIDRFRPNIIVSGTEPFEEDSWLEISIGSQQFRVIQQCERCVFTTIDPITQQRHPGGEPLKTLSKYRLSHEGGVVLGVHAVPIQPLNNEIKLQDEIQVHSRQHRPMRNSV